MSEHAPRAERSDDDGGFASAPRFARRRVRSERADTFPSASNDEQGGCQARTQRAERAT